MYMAYVCYVMLCYVMLRCVALRYVRLRCVTLLSFTLCYGIYNNGTFEHQHILPIMGTFRILAEMSDS
jgi:hypothetical protein